MTIYFFLLLLLNLWIWKIVSVSLLIGLVVILTTIFRVKKIGIFLLFLLLFFQVKTTNRVPLTHLSEDEIVRQIQRMREYDNPRIAHILEERPEALVFFRIQNNLSQLVDPNFYFFANHPRERAGINEFEKFPYLLIPFFIYGFYKLVRKKEYFFLIFYLFLPLLVLSLIGLNNPLGPFSLFPFILATSYEGFIKKPIFAGIYVLFFLQVLAYALY